jgi:hypothetical protein
MKIKGDSIFSTSFGGIGGGLGFNNILAETAVGGVSMPPITDNLTYYYAPDSDVYSDTGSTLALDGENIRQWNDQSGNGNTLNQATAVDQPIYRTSILGNGNTGVQAELDFFTPTTNISIPNEQNGFTFYAVYKRDDTNNEFYINVLSTNTNCRMEWTGSQHKFRSTAGSARYISYTANLDTKIVAYSLDRVADTFKMYVNGSFHGDFLGGSVVDYPIEWDKLFNSNYGITFGNQLLYGEAHNASEVASISSWLNDKYVIY